VTSVTKYPTAYTNPDSWSDPAYALGVADGYCTEKGIVGSASKYLYLSGYGFTIPANAVLDNVFIDHKGMINTNPPSGQVLTFVFKDDAFQECPDTQSDVVFGGGCDQTAYKGEVDILPLLVDPLSVADLNNETFTTYLHAAGALPVGQYFDCDAAYIRVVYHVPTVTTRKCFGDGFFWRVK